MSRSAAPLALFALACSAPPDEPLEALVVDVPDAFDGSGAGSIPSDQAWWESFRSDSLRWTVGLALEESLDLRQAWSRLAQADAAADAAGAPRYPAIDLGTDVTRLEIDQRGGGGAFLPVRVGEVYGLGPSLSYELDVFGRIRATEDAALYAAEASAADVHATALTLTGQVVDAWFVAVENAALEALVLDQVRTGEELVELTRARFQNGGGSALDVLQQQRLVEATRAELPVVRGSRERAEHQLVVLSGIAPQEAESYTSIPSELPVLPPLPELDVPAALLERRPDLIAAFQRVAQADRDVAAAVRARYPRLTLSASYDFDATEVADLFDRTITVITANLVAPLTDGGSRRAEVRRTRAVLEERILDLSRSFLVALQEVEDALSLERRGVERTATCSDAPAQRSRTRSSSRRGCATPAASTRTCRSSPPSQNLQALEREIVGGARRRAAGPRPAPTAPSAARWTGRARAARTRRFRRRGSSHRRPPPVPAMTSPVRVLGLTLRSAGSRPSLVDRARPPFAAQRPDRSPARHRPRSEVPPARRSPSTWSRVELTADRTATIPAYGTVEPAAHAHRATHRRRAGDRDVHPALLVEGGRIDAGELIFRDRRARLPARAAPRPRRTSSPPAPSSTSSSETRRSRSKEWALLEPTRSR